MELILLIASGAFLAWLVRRRRQEKVGEATRRRIDEAATIAAHRDELPPPRPERVIRGRTPEGALRRPYGELMEDR